MKLDLSFRLAEDKRDILIVEKNLLEHPLNYKGYPDWVEKIKGELWSGYKQVIIALSEDYWVGHLISQPHKSISRFWEMKSGRTREDFRQRYILSFMIRQSEFFATKEGYLGVICDARSDRLDVVNLLLGNGYREIARSDLYREGYEDIIFFKPLGDFKNFNSVLRI